jgi:hypothetical protein
MTTLAVLVVGALTLAGCGNPGGVDGDLTDDWAAFAEPRPFVPGAGVCHLTEFADTAPLDAYQPVVCVSTHRVETVHVGTFPDPAGPTPPARDSAQIRAAYTECDGKAREYVGDEWRHGRLWLGVALPTATAWTAGARWFRCDLRELDNVEDDGQPVERTATLRDALTEVSPLRLTCYAIRVTDTGTVASMPSAGCDERHNGEFVGVWRAPDDLAYPARDSDWARFYDECYDVLAGYVGVPVDRNLRARAGVVTLPASEAAWRLGDRGVRCYLWISDARFTRSLKGVGEAGLPARRG